MFDTAIRGVTRTRRRPFPPMTPAPKRAPDRKRVELSARGRPYIRRSFTIQAWQVLQNRAHDTPQKEREKKKKKHHYM